jgi:hypothetical protein
MALNLPWTSLPCWKYWRGRGPTGPEPAADPAGIKTISPHGQSRRVEQESKGWMPVLSLVRMHPGDKGCDLAWINGLSGQSLPTAKAPRGVVPASPVARRKVRWRRHLGVR